MGLTSPQQYFSHMETEEKKIKIQGIRVRYPSSLRIDPWFFIVPSVKHWYTRSPLTTVWLNQRWASWLLAMYPSCWRTQNVPIWWVHVDPPHRGEVTNIEEEIKWNLCKWMVCEQKHVASQRSVESQFQFNSLWNCKLVRINIVMLLCFYCWLWTTKYNIINASAISICFDDLPIDDIVLIILHR